MHTATSLVPLGSRSRWGTGEACSDLALCWGPSWQPCRLNSGLSRRESNGGGAWISSRAQIGCGRPHDSEWLGAERIDCPLPARLPLRHNCVQVLDPAQGTAPPSYNHHSHIFPPPCQFLSEESDQLDLRFATRGFLLRPYSVTCSTRTLSIQFLYHRRNLGSSLWTWSSSIAWVIGDRVSWVPRSFPGFVVAYHPLLMYLSASLLDFIAQLLQAFLHSDWYLRRVPRRLSLEDRRVQPSLPPSFTFRLVQPLLPLRLFQNLPPDSSFLRFLLPLHFIDLPVVLRRCYPLHLIPRRPPVTVIIVGFPSLRL